MLTIFKSLAASPKYICGTNIQDGILFFVFVKSKLLININKYL